MSTTQAPTVGPNAKYLDDLEVGHVWTSAARTITEADVVFFATWSGDMHPLHTNEEYAKTTDFGTRIFHGPGALALAFGLEIGLGWKDGSAIAFLGLKDWTMKAPVFIGDTIHVREEVTEIRPSSSKPDRGVVTTKAQILNQRDEVCQEGEWLVLLKRQPSAG